MMEGLGLQVGQVWQSFETGTCVQVIDLSRYSDMVTYRYYPIATYNKRLSLMDFFGDFAYLKEGSLVDEG